VGRRPTKARSRSSRVHRRNLGQDQHDANLWS
jgi:hypothetical protein